ncbi:MAG: NUDIX domain-containing protein [Pseudonocardia sp.]|nr:NUDIX domain-containing protein [Pseudonocardia sp.]
MSELPIISVSVKAAVVREVSDGPEVLLVSYDDEAGFHYNLPGGKAREGEQLRDAVRRKVAQETGLVVDPTRLLFVVEYVPSVYGGEFGDQHKIQFNFLALPADPVAQPLLPDPPEPDQVGFEWVRLAELGGKYLLPRITDFLIEALTSPGLDGLVDRW